MIYAVHQQYFDDGTVKAHVWGVAGHVTPEPIYQRKPRCDEYLDFFETKPEADTFYQQALDT